MSAFRSYSDWMKNSNEAGVYRAALEAIDKVPRELFWLAFNPIFCASEAAWREYKKNED